MSPLWIVIAATSILASITGAKADVETEVSKHNQISHATNYNRYPILYRRVLELSAQRLPLEAQKILVFGASTGEEPLTIAGLFSKAVVVGVDVDEETLSQARKLVASRKLDDRVFFFNSLVHPMHLMGTYDIIFANSALCLHPVFDPSIYPFSNFKHTVHLLLRNLHQGGLLAIVNPSYRVMDVVDSNYVLHPVPVCPQGRPDGFPHKGEGCCEHFVPQHARDGNLLPGLEDKCIYQKTTTGSSANARQNHSNFSL